MREPRELHCRVRHDDDDWITSRVIVVPMQSISDRRDNGSKEGGSEEDDGEAEVKGGGEVIIADRINYHSEIVLCQWTVKTVQPGSPRS